MKLTGLLICCIYLSWIEATPQNYILNGQVANSSPSFVLIHYETGSNNMVFGGGHIISNKHVITSGHILYNSIVWIVMFGSNEIAEQRIIVSSESVIHSLYNPNTRANDIGIIILPELLIFNENIKSIMLPGLAQQLPYENEQGIVNGFGWTADVPEPPQFLLRSTFKRVSSNLICEQLFSIHSDEHFCASDALNSSNVCQGDLGGGFIVHYRSRTILVGIASKIIDACSHLHPAAYTRVSHYRNWIIQVTQII